MATWQKEDHGEWTCPKCGRVYQITCQRFPGKDHIEIACECGRTIFSGNTTHGYTATFKRQGDPACAKNNPPLG